MPEEPEEVLGQEAQEAPEGEEQTPETQEQAPSQEVEAEARETGWVPKEEFKGDPAKWRPAGEWVERGKRILTIVQPRLKKAEEENAALRDELRMTKKAIEEVKERSDREARERYERKLAALQDAQRDAAAAGDVEEYDAIEEEKAKLKPPEPASTAKPEQAPEQKVQADADALADEWAKKNPWFDQDPAMRSYAAHSLAFLQETTGEKQVSAALLDKVTEEVKRRFPEKFTNPRREEAGTVEGGGAGGSGARQARGGNGSLFAKLSASAQAVYHRQVADWKTKGQEFPYSPDEWAKAREE